ncbi:hypothetical protein IQ238_12530 [Pleurocapsales cyanobacterium LEGE 06147]|nr:hypothetical protein [Pleurocapsales cyanobacterium LEGE 06147]
MSVSSVRHTALRDVSMVLPKDTAKTLKEREVIPRCEEMLEHANRVLVDNQKAISQFLIDPDNKQKAYQELAELLNVHTGIREFEKCLFTLESCLYDKRISDKIKRILRGLISKVKTLQNCLSLLEPPESKYAKMATTTYYDGTSKWAVVDILHKIPFSEEEATALSKRYLDSLRDLVRKLASDITCLKQYCLVHDPQDEAIVFQQYLEQLITDLQKKHPQANEEQAAAIIGAKFKTQHQWRQNLLSLKRLWNGVKKGSFKAGEHLAEETLWGKALIGFIEGVTDGIE